MKNSSSTFSLLTGRSPLFLASVWLTVCAGGCATGDFPGDGARIIALGRKGHPGDDVVVQHDPTPQSPGPHQNVIRVSSTNTEVLVTVVPIIGSKTHEKKIVITSLKPFVPTVREE